MEYTINSKDSKAVEKLLLLLVKDQLVIKNATTTLSRGQKTTTGRVAFLSQNALGAKFIEFANGDLRLDINTENINISLVDIAGFLHLNTAFNSLYQNFIFSNLKLHVGVSNKASGHDCLLVEGIVKSHTTLDSSLLGINVGALKDFTLSVCIEQGQEHFKRKTSVSLIAKLFISGKPILVALRLPTSGQLFWRLQQLTPALSFNLQSLDKLTMESKIFEALPPQLKNVTSFNLGQLAIEFNPKKRRLHNIDFTLVCAAPWDLLTNTNSTPILSLNDISLVANIYANASGKYHYGGDLNGTIQLGSFKTSVSIPLPITGKISLYSNTISTLTDLNVFSTLLAETSFSDLLLSGNFENNFSMEVEEIEMDINLKDKLSSHATLTYFLLNGIASMDFSIANFVLSLLFNMRLEYLGVEKLKLELNAQTNLLLGNIALTLVGNYDSNTNGWLLNGHTNESILLEDLLDALATKFDFIQAISSSLDSIKLNKLECSFNTATNAFAFTGTSNFEVNNTILTIQIVLGFTHSENGALDKTFATQLIIGQTRLVAFNLTFDDRKNSSAILASFQDEEGIQLSMAEVIEDLLDIEMPAVFSMSLKAAALAINKTNTAQTGRFTAQLGKNIDFLNLSATEQLAAFTKTTNPSEARPSYLFVVALDEEISLQNFAKQLEAGFAYSPLMPNLPIPAELIPDVDLTQVLVQYDPVEKGFAFCLLADQGTRELLLFFWPKHHSNPADYYLQVRPGPEITLQRLPFLGKQIPADPVVALEELQVRFGSPGWGNRSTNELISAMTGSALSNTPAEHPEEVQLWSANTSGGIFISGFLRIGDLRIPLNLPLQIDTLTDPPSSTGATDIAAESENSSVRPSPIKWFKVNKQIGPVRLSRIGLQYKNKKVWFYVDASLVAGPVTLTLLGLGVGTSFNQFNPSFDLQGLGLSFNNGMLSIGGALLRENETTFSGAAFIKTTDLVLSALGRYQELPNSSPSLFLYALLGRPIGGPPFFFVTGLSLGFGVNQQIRKIGLEEVEHFPLIQQALQASPLNIGAPDLSELTRTMSSLGPYLRPQAGASYLVAGLKFTTFKLIDSVALLISRFESPFVLDIIGLSELRIPAREVNAISPVQPLALIKMPFTVRFQPAEGALRVRAKLSRDSYILTGAATLQGAFAYYAWFKGAHAGDFVVSAGGYHPQFKLQHFPHYPQVPRLRFHWQINPALNMAGTAYFALTPNFLMCGMDLRTTFRAGPLEVWFGFAADFLIRWQPFYYEGNVRISVGFALRIRVRIKAGFFSFTISVTLRANAGATLALWGPDFGGAVGVSVGFAAISIGFGANRLKKPDRISWQQFRQSFLPPADRILRIAAIGGIIPQKQNKRWIINPSAFELIVESVIPISESGQHHFGIAPMNIGQEQNSKLKLHMKYQNQPVPFGDDFAANPIYKNVANALWGQSSVPAINSKGTRKVLLGFRIRPAKNPVPGATRAIEKEKLLFDMESVGSAVHWQDNLHLDYPVDGVKNELNLEDPDLLVELGFDPETAVDLRDLDLKSTYKHAPQFVSLG